MKVNETAYHPRYLIPRVSRCRHIVRRSDRDFYTTRGWRISADVTKNERLWPVVRGRRHRRHQWRADVVRLDIVLSSYVLNTMSWFEYLRHLSVYTSRSHEDGFVLFSFDRTDSVDSFVHTLFFHPKFWEFLKAFCLDRSVYCREEDKTQDNFVLQRH